MILHTKSTCVGACVRECVCARARENLPLFMFTRVMVHFKKQAYKNKSACPYAKKILTLQTNINSDGNLKHGLSIKINYNN